MRRISTAANVYRAMIFVLAVGAVYLSPAAAGEGPKTAPTLQAAGVGASLPDRHDWDLKPFVKRQQPVLSPTPDSRFQCPIRGKEVRWEERNVYNPAAVVRGGKVYLLYRADDKSPDLKWGRTCRIPEHSAGRDWC